MAKDPDDRYPTATAFTDAARAVVGDPQQPRTRAGADAHEARRSCGQRPGNVHRGHRRLPDRPPRPGEGKLGSDIEISRQHARITRDQHGQYVIEDLGSTNGTFVNGARLSAPQVLHPGDTIEVGDTRLVVGPGRSSRRPRSIRRHRRPPRRFAAASAAAEGAPAATTTSAAAAAKAAARLHRRLHRRLHPRSRAPHPRPAPARPPRAGARARARRGGAPATPSKPAQPEAPPSAPI